MKIILFVLVYFAFTHSVEAGEQPKHFTGVPRVDLFSSSIHLPIELISFFDSLHVETMNAEQFSSIPNKSPWLAGVLSLALPGAGEFYSESYMKSAVFFAAELAGWIVAYTYDKKGDRQTDVFQDYADLYWSVVRYAIWMNTFKNASISINPNETLPPWERVNWDILNFYERLGGFGFTHTLPRHGEQQYYELIGKYHQYSPGWDDYTSGQDFLSISPRFSEYSAMRGKANDYYNITSTAVSVVVVNHILSAIDAFFTASNFNKSFHAEARMKLRQTPFGAVAETVGMMKVMF